MLSRLREHLGAAGLIVAIVALVAALAGGALAANSGGGKATASAKAKQGPRGKTGKTGKTGPAGPAGAAGAQGPAGAAGAAGASGEDGEKGKNGTNGTNGVNGTDGASVDSTEFSGAQGTCTEGGTKLVGTSTTYACNGKKGVDGEDGETGFTETLPSGKTETGAWTFGVIPAAAVPTEQPPFSERLYVPISFTIPLPSELDEAHVHILKKGDPATTECPGSAVAPQALAGHLCVYTGEEQSWGGESPAEISQFVQAVDRPGASGLGGGASRTGGLLSVLILEKRAYAAGTWAVTAP